MKKTDLGQTIQILANVGVIVGIVFLVLEISQNNEQLAAQARYNYYQERIEITRAVALNGEISAIFAKQFAGEPLSVVESIRSNSFVESLFAAWEYEYGELQSGRVTAEEFNVAAKRGRFESLRIQLGPAWAEYRKDAPAGFVQFIDREIARE